MRIKKKDTEKIKTDQSSVIRHFLPENATFSITELRIDGEHRNNSEAEIAYYVKKGEGIIKKENHIEELEKEDVYYAGKKNHKLEGAMELLVVRTPPAKQPEQQL